jgi:hypothetical protein
MYQGAGRWIWRVFVLGSGSRTLRVVAVHRPFWQLAVRPLEYTAAEVARYLGATTSFPSQAGLADSEELSEVSQ